MDRAMIAEAGKQYAEECVGDGCYEIIDLSYHVPSMPSEDYRSLSLAGALVGDEMTGAADRIYWDAYNAAMQSSMVGAHII